MSQAYKVHAIPRKPETANDNSLQDFLHHWFLPHPETKVIEQQASKGIFLPWPLLTIIVTLAVILVSGLVTLEVQVSNLNTTLLLRDADHARQLLDIESKLAKETDRRELTDLKVADLRERQIRQESRKN